LQLRHFLSVGSVFWNPNLETNLRKSKAASIAVDTVMASHRFHWSTYRNLAMAEEGSCSSVTPAAPASIRLGFVVDEVTWHILIWFSPVRMAAPVLRTLSCPRRYVILEADSGVTVLKPVVTLYTTRFNRREILRSTCRVFLNVDMCS
jgi:hypothetical protein